MTVAIATVLLSIAAPSFRSVVLNSQMTSRYNDIPADLRLARSEAISQAADVVVCARASDTACGDSWSAGWLMFVEDPAGTIGTLDAGETILKARTFDGSDLSIDARAVIGSEDATAVGSIGFGPRGRASWTSGTFVVCDSRGVQAARALIINGSGNVRQAHASSLSANVVTDAEGMPVSCP